MTESEKRGRGIHQQRFRMRIHGQRHYVKAALVLVMMFRRTLAIIVNVAAADSGSAGFTALIHFLRTDSAMVSIRRQGAEIHSGEHAEHHQPCEKVSHQRVAHLFRIPSNSRKFPPQILRRRAAPGFGIASRRHMQNHRPFKNC